MNDFSRLLDRLEKDKEKMFAMATIIRVDGSAYRREGAKMLIGRDGSYYGTISAGCLEEDLIHQSMHVLESYQPKIVKYDLRSEDDDLSWGQGAGCDGNIEIYIEPIGWEWNQINQSTLLWPHIYEQLEQGQTLVTVKCMKEGDRQGAFILSSTDGRMIGGSLGQDVEYTLIPYIHQFSISRPKVKLMYIEELKGDYLFELYLPQDKLFIFGAGPDAEPLVELASKLDFSVTVIDPRSSRCSEDFFPKADCLINEHPESFFNRFEIPYNSYVLIMTHNFNRDQIILEYLLQAPPKYLGVLGPKRRTKRLVNDKTSLSFIHSPIGLSIGAEGPEEISISVLAELIKIRNQSAFNQTSQPVECWI
ncbi:XdhC family protein [Neobacillus mesonae]|uniref:XdhC family protein n=1 Tax=Neobacillus mesonae TaxID=1193713 RepID=UPI00082CF442|nr:XdhC/CoxI family protein [Neobacillus mesonae]